jgi:thioredoxin-related protein
MKYILFAFTFAASVCAAPVLFAGSGLMDGLIKPYDDTLIELPGETARKPSVSRSAQLVDDSAADILDARSEKSSVSEKKPSSSSSTSTKSSSASSSPSTSTRSKSFTEDGVYIPYSERYPEEKKEKPESGFDRDTFDPDFKPFKNDYRYKDTDYQPNRTRPEFDEMRQKIKDVLGEGVPRVMVDSKADELIHNSARSEALEAPTTPARWTRAPNGWFCDFDDAMEKAQQTGKAVAVFFHSSDNNNSRKFKTERMENNKFKNKMRDRLLVVYMDYPDTADTSKDKRYREQVQHNTRIAEKFHVTNYPTVIILDSAGKEIGRLDTNTNATISTFVEKAEKIVPLREVKEKKQTGFKVGGSITDESDAR